MLSALILTATTGALLTPPPGSNGQHFQQQNAFALPPASARDVAAEMTAAASLLRKDVLPLSGIKDERKPLVVIAVRENAYQQLVGEKIQEITDGKQAGTTWIKPVALRLANNISVAVAAEEYDPVLGWLDADIGGSSVHLFSPLAPAAFVPTHSLQSAPASLAILVRSLAEAHASAAEEDEEGLNAARGKDFAALRAFMAHVAELPPPPLAPPGLYDPLGGFGV